MEFQITGSCSRRIGQGVRGPVCHVSEQEDPEGRERDWRRGVAQQLDGRSSFRRHVEDQNKRGQVLILSAEARPQCPDVVVASPGVSMKYKRGGVVTARELVDGTRESMSTGRPGSATKSELLRARCARCHDKKSKSRSIREIGTFFGPQV